MDYQRFKKDYESSGLNQRAYSEQKKISASMVSYYLRKAREQTEQAVTKGQPKFKPLKVQARNSSNVKNVKLTLPHGIVLEISL